MMVEAARYNARLSGRASLESFSGRRSLDSRLHRASLRMQAASHCALSSSVYATAARGARPGQKTIYRLMTNVQSLVWLLPSVNMHD
jgi:hypothetical protein